MNENAGLWIDHRQAVIVVRTGDQEQIRHIESHMPKRVRYSGVSEARGKGIIYNDTSEDGRDRRFHDQANRYYDEVIAVVRDAEWILILGPGEAKIELQKRMETHGLSEHIAAVKPADKLTEPQIAAEVRHFFEHA
jgi:hypothetical protein